MPDSAPDYDELIRKNRELQARLDEAEDRLRSSREGDAAALRESEERLRLAQLSAGVGIWDWETGTNRLTFTPELEALYGLAPGTIRTYQDWRTLAHPDDINGIEAERDVALSGRRPFNLEFRILHNSGEIRWLSSQGGGVYDESGDLIRVLGVNIDVTGRKRTEKQFLDLSRRLLALMNAVPIGISFSEDETNLRITGNPALMAQFELRPDDNVSASARENDAAGRKIHYFQDGREMAADELPLQKALLEGRAVPPMEIEVELPSGRRWICEASGSPILDEEGNITGGVAVTVDITSRKRAEEALRASEALYRAIGETIDYGVWVCSPDGRNTYSSESFLKMVGITQEQCSNFGWGEVLHPDDTEKTITAWKECVRTGGKWDIEHRFRGVDGHWRYVLARGVPIRDEHGKVTCWAGINLDITERKLIEEELARYRESLESLVRERTAELVEKNARIVEEVIERQRAEAEALNMQKLDSLRVLAGGIAHDLNNLMVAVLGNAGLALSELPSDSPARRYVADIEKATEKVTNFSKQILSFTSKAAVKREPVLLNVAVRETAHFLTASISRNAEIGYSISEDLPAIMAEPQNMQQVVMNLVINASDAIGESKGSIKVSTGAMLADRGYLDSLHPSGLPEGGYAYIEVSDTGCGMSPETRSRIFEPFYTTKFTGRGLGLSAVYGIVTAHGGAVGVQSGEGRGTTFRVLLPLPAEKVEPVAVAPAPEGVWSGEGLILVVDDERPSLMMAKMVLENAGYSVLTAGDGAEAVEIFRNNAGSVSAVVMDLIMPHVRGDAAAMEMRNIRADIDILLLSGYHEIDLSGLSGGPGKTELLGKPYRITQLLEATKNILKA